MHVIFMMRWMREKEKEVGCKFGAGSPPAATRIVAKVEKTESRHELNINVAVHTCSKLLDGWAIRIVKMTWLC